MTPRPGDDFDRDILDIIPERYDADADSHEARAGQRLRNVVTIVAAVVAVGSLAAVGLHFLGGKRGGGDGVPVIKADDRPFKTKPDDRGGIQVPNQDKLVYDRVEGESSAPVERLLPPAETPKAPPRAAPAETLILPPAAAAGGTAAPAAPPPAAGDPAQPQAAQSQMAQGQPAPGQSGAAPAPVGSALAPPPPVTSYRPVGARETSAGATPPPAAAPAAPAPAKVAATAPAPVPVTKPRPAPTPAPAAPHPAAAPAPAAPARSGGGGFLIQLGAVRAADQAGKEWARIQKANADLLGGLASDIVRVDLGEKGVFWRIRAGGLDEASARQICASLQSRHQGCIVARR